jgi:hypothetical protein
MLNLTDQEQQLLLELLEAAHKEMIQGIDHTDTRDYRELLKQKTELLEGLIAKIRNLNATGPASEC